MACTAKEVSQHCEPLYPCRARERVRHRHRHSDSSSIPASSCRPPPPRGSRPATHSTQHTAHSEGHREKRQAVLSGGKIIRPTHHAGQVPQEGRAEPAAASASASAIAYASSSPGPVRPEETRRGDANPTQPNPTPLRSLTHRALSSSSSCPPQTQSQSPPVLRRVVLGRRPTR